MDATGSRIMGRLKDKRGRDLTEMATRYGVNQVGLFSTEDEIRAAQWGAAENRIDEPVNDWEKAAIQIEQATQNEMRYEQQFKQEALNEKELAYYNAPQMPGETLVAYQQRKKVGERFVDTSVQVRNLDRTLENKSEGPLGDGIDTGLIGVIEGLYGTAQMVGEETGFKWLENVGTAGIKRQHAYLADMLQLLFIQVRPGMKWVIIKMQLLQLPQGLLKRY